MSDQNNEDQTALEELRYEASLRDQIISQLEARALKAEQQCRDLCQSDGDVRARLADAENALADLRLKIEIEAQWFYAHHDGSLVTSDYPMVARRIHALLDGTS